MVVLWSSLPSAAFSRNQRETKGQNKSNSDQGGRQNWCTYTQHVTTWSQPVHVCKSYTTVGVDSPLCDHTFENLVGTDSAFIKF